MEVKPNKTFQTPKTHQRIFRFHKIEKPKSILPPYALIFAPHTSSFTVVSSNKNKKVCRQGLEKPEIVNNFIDKKVTYICCGKLVNKPHNIILPPPRDGLMRSSD